MNTMKLSCDEMFKNCFTLGHDQEAKLIFECDNYIILLLAQLR